jgi:hypothetical protein
MGEQTIAITHHLGLAKQCVDSVHETIKKSGVTKANYQQLWATLARAIVYLRSTDDDFCKIDSVAKGMR